MTSCLLLEKESLIWFPCYKEAPNGYGGKFVMAHKLCRSFNKDGAEDPSCGQYRVTHYGPDAWGRAFGPLALDQFLLFCHALDCLIKEGQGVGVGCGGSSEERANAAVLIGGYLAVRHEWSEDQIKEAVGPADAELTFACSWLRNDAPRVLKVTDCWAGIAMACHMHWLDSSLIEDHEVIKKACAAYRTMGTTYDAAWLAPGYVMVCADPVTTVADPNPNTFMKIFPDEPTAEGTVASTGPVTATTSQRSSRRSFDSCDTVCKDYRISENIIKADDQEALSFVTLLQECDIGLVVRTNCVDEPGMPGYTYDRRRLMDYGISHADIFIEDYGGGLPSPSQVSRLLEEADGYAAAGGAQGAAIHCKGGFGRSVTMACLLTIVRFDLPGRGLLGWVRITRPGAVTTTKQERFICRMKGKQDVLQYASPGKNICGCAVL